MYHIVQVQVQVVGTKSKVGIVHMYVYMLTPCDVSGQRK